MKANAPRRTDSEIHREVIQELSHDTVVDETEVGVEVKNGIVTLTGTVNSYAKKVAALEAVYRVPGVPDVANDLEVRLPGDLAYTDAEVASAVRDALERNPLIPHEQIRTAVTDGWVTLKGEVPTWLSREEADWLVWRILGVRGVSNRITVAAPAVNPIQLREKIEEALERRADREADRIGITVEGDTVVLTGVVHDWSEKRAIIGTVGSAHGVRKLEDRLVIDPYL